MRQAKRRGRNRARAVALKQRRQINGERKDDRMEQIKVWTKQHENVLKELNETGRYIARREYIRSDLQDWCWRYMTGW